MGNNIKRYSTCIAVFTFVFVTVLFIIFHIVKLSRETRVVKSKLGLIKGVRSEDGHHTKYLGIPYAVVNESNPFGNAIPHTRFEDVFLANDDTAVCLQQDQHNSTILGTIDCLQLHIHVPNSASHTSKLPVLIYIGDNNIGRFFYGSKVFKNQGFIFVTLNYRIGPYGFLCLNTTEELCNQGLKDQILAMRWIKNNIEAFGGHSNKITLAGESADYHLAFGNETLFNNVIIGTEIFTEGMLLRPADKEVPLKLAADLGLKTNDTNEAISYLIKQDPFSVIKSSDKLKINYGPCVKETLHNGEIFMTNLTDVEDVSSVRNIPVLVTQSSNEMLYKLANKNLDEDDQENIFKEVLLAVFDISEEKLDSIVEQVRHFYIDNEKVSEAMKQSISDFLSDIFINYPIRQKIKSYLKYGAEKIYYSIFSYTGERDLAKELSKIDGERVPHINGLGYLYDVSYLKNATSTNDQLMITRVTTLWHNFIKYSNPTPERTALLPIIWEPVTDKSLLYLNIDINLSMGIKPFNDRMLFWEKFYKENDVARKLVTGPWEFDV